MRRHRIDRRRGKVRTDEPAFRTYRGRCHLCHNPTPLHEPGTTEKPLWCRPCHRLMKTECGDCGVQPGQEHFELCHIGGDPAAIAAMEEAVPGLGLETSLQELGKTLERLRQATQQQKGPVS